MIIKGNEIAEDLKRVLQKEVEKLSPKPSLGVFVFTDDPVIARFVARKKKYAEEIGVSFTAYDASEITETKEAVSFIQEKSKLHDGLIVQLPVSKTLDEQELLDAVPVSQDVDVLSTDAKKQFEEGKLPILPSVVGSIQEILMRGNVSISGKNVVIVGKGKLVGQPAATWFAQQGAQAAVVTEDTEEIEKELKEADIIVSGAGVPGLITKNLIKDGAVILDAGTSEAKGKLVGDIDPACAEKASLFTPVPGGIGPITVAMIFKNLLRD